MMKILDQVKKTLETKKVKYLIGNNNNSNNDYKCINLIPEPFVR